MGEMEHRIILFVWGIYKTIKQMPKAIFYVRTIAATINLRRTVCNWLCKAGLPKIEALQMIREFHGQLTDTTREEIFQGFKRGQYRFICATTAFGFGVNPPDAMVIVQEGRTNPVEVWQKGGRAARSIRNGYFFYLGERRLQQALVNKPLTQLQDSQRPCGKKRKLTQLSTSQKPMQKKQKVSLLEQLLPGEAELWANPTFCGRRWILDCFNEPQIQLQDCCNRRNPVKITLPPIPQTENVPRNVFFITQPKGIEKALQFIRARWAEREQFYNSLLPTFGTDLACTILPNATIKKWITNPNDILLDHKLDDWPWRGLLGNEVIELLWRCSWWKVPITQIIKDARMRLPVLASPSGDIQNALQHAGIKHQCSTVQAQKSPSQPLKVYTDPVYATLIPSIHPSLLQSKPVQELPTYRATSRKVLAEISCNIGSQDQGTHHRITRRGIMSVMKRRGQSKTPIPASRLQ